MTRRSTVRITSLVCLMLIATLMAHGDVMKNNVSFADVIALEVPEPDMIMSYGEEPLQFGELWLPPGASRGLLLLLHGGCWLNAYDVKHSRPMAVRLASSGYTVWSIEYRRLGDAGGGVPGTFDDVSLAASQLGLLSAHGVDVSKTIVVGHSAGGHLALWLAASFPASIHGVVGLAAITDLAEYASGDSGCQQAAFRLMGGGVEEQAERYRIYSPHNLAPQANTFLVQGKQDSIVAPAQAAALHIDHSQTIYTDGGHFDLIHPHAAAFQAVERTISNAFRNVTP